jgi:transcriptional regulator with XRE-family HTH domain
MSPNTQSKSDHAREYERAMLRSAFVSLFWSVIADLKKRRGYRLQELADAVGVDKSGVSRWFSGGNPNWTLNTVADVANALNVDLRIELIDRETKAVHTPQGQKVAFEIAEYGVRPRAFTSTHSDLVKVAGTESARHAA